MSRLVTSQHEGLTQIATFDLELTGDMIRALHNVPIPKSGEAFIASPDLSEADPGVCRADAAILYGKGKEKMTYPYQDEYAESLMAKGKAEGIAVGEARAVLRIFDKRGIVVSDEVRSLVMRCKDKAVLVECLERVFEGKSAEEIFRPEDFEA